MSANIAQYPITQCQYRSNPSVKLSFNYCIFSFEILQLLLIVETFYIG